MRNNWPKIREDIFKINFEDMLEFLEFADTNQLHIIGTDGFRDLGNNSVQPVALLNLDLEDFDDYKTFIDFIRTLLKKGVVCLDELGNSYPVFIEVYI